VVKGLKILDRETVITKRSAGEIIGPESQNGNAEVQREKTDQRRNTRSGDY